MNYKYAGAVPVAVEEALERAEQPYRKAKTRKGNNKAECGTVGGYQKHMRLDEPVCEPCRIAKNKALAAVRGYEFTGRKNNMGADKCGSPYGYQLHRARGEEACFRCRVAATERRQKYNKTRKDTTPATTLNPQKGPGTQGVRARSTRAEKPPTRTLKTVHTGMQNR